MTVFKIQNKNKLIKAFKKAPVITENWLLKALKASVQSLQKFNRRGITPWDTGTMSQTFQSKIRKDSARFFPTREYAKFVYYGTKNQRPQKFLDHILSNATFEIQRHFNDALNRITAQIAKQSL